MNPLLICIFIFLYLSSSVRSQLPSSSSCGGDGYNLDLLTQLDLTFTSGVYQYSIRPCGVIANSSFDYRCTIENAMICQKENGNNGFVLGKYNRQDAASYRWIGAPNGVRLIVSNGDICPIAPSVRHSTILQFECNATASTPFIQTIFRYSIYNGCRYTVIIQTSLACSRTLPAPSNQVGMPFYSYDCGGQLYDLKSTFTSDLQIQSNYIHLCGRLNSPSLPSRCAELQPISFCAIGGSPGRSLYQSTSWNERIANLYSITPSGLNITWMNPFDLTSELAPLFVHLQLVCVSSAITPIALSAFTVNEYSWSDIYIVIHTASVCASPALPTSNLPPPISTKCGGEGYVLDGLTQTELSLPAEWATYVIKPCGVIQPTTEWLCSYQNAMFCGKRNEISFYSGSEIARYDPLYAEQEYRWIPTSSGVMLLTENGHSCEVNLRSKIEFVCNVTAITPFLSNVVPPPVVCRTSFTVVIQTSLACNRVLPFMSSEIGAWWYSSECGGGLYNLTSVTSTDLQVSSELTGETYFIHVCGPVISPLCATAGPSIVCYYNHPRPPVAVSRWNASIPYRYTVTPTGLKMSQLTVSSANCSSSAIYGSGNPMYDEFELICMPDAVVPVVIGMTNTRKLWCNNVVTIYTSAVCNGHNGPVPQFSSSSSSSIPVTSSSSSIPVTSSSSSSTTQPITSSSHQPSSSSSSMSTSTSSSTASSSSSSASQLSSSGNTEFTITTSTSSLNDAAVIGIVIGIVLAALVLPCLGFVLGMRYKSSLIAKSASVGESDSDMESNKWVSSTNSSDDVEMTLSC